MSSLITLKPRMSEKTYELSQRLGTYVFEVPRNASKQSIAEAVEAQFKVTVTNVNAANAIGKTMRTARKGSRPVMGKRANTRRAYVTLKEGDSIPIFAAVEEPADKSDVKPGKPAAKSDKKSVKQESK